MKDLTIVWFRLDLRTTDNPALEAAARRGYPVLPVFIHAPEEEAPWAPGASSRWWLRQSLRALDADLRRVGSRLVICEGPSLVALRRLAKECAARAVFWNRRYEPALIARDREIESALLSDGIAVQSFNSALLHDPAVIANQSGRPFQVFTPFWRHCLAKLDPSAPLAEPTQLSAPHHWPRSMRLPELEAESTSDRIRGLQAAWQPGAAGAQERLQRFLNDAAVDYTHNRDRPGLAATSKLSPHLHFGEVSPRQIWHAIRCQAESCGVSERIWRASRYLAEIGWREFAHYLLHHFPEIPDQPLRAKFARFQWREDPERLAAWQHGTTGYPIVDAAMRELRTTGWMHNRARMIAASFLVKDLLTSWQQGTRWFWDSLVDADLAQNTLGWQWVAGCGADAAPFFRVFNPVTQGEKFDPLGKYVRQWCPELAKLPDAFIQKPWQAPRETLKRAGVILGESYPEPVINHTIAREVALEAFARI